MIFAALVSQGLLPAHRPVSAADNALIPAGRVLRISVPEAIGGKTVVGQLTVDRAVGAGYVTAYGCDDDIPTNLGDALDLLEADTALIGVLGEEFVKVYDSVKRNEYKEFLQVISPWEREHLLLNV